MGGVSREETILEDPERKERSALYSNDGPARTEGKVRLLVMLTPLCRAAPSPEILRPPWKCQHLQTSTCGRGFFYLSFCNFYFF